MTRDREWIERKLSEIEDKRKMLQRLEETLTKWEQEVDWDELPKEKQAALMALAEESVETLTTMIERLGQQIREGVAEIESENGELAGGD